MNSNQRKYLIDKIKERTQAKISNLKASIPQVISLNAHMLHKVMSNDFEIKPVDELKKIVLEKALRVGKEKAYREDWLGNAWGMANKNNIGFDLHEFFIIPEEYLEWIREQREKSEAVWEEINFLQNQLETLEIRIMLASDKNLQTLINEVDDMGDISLIDTKIKLLN